MYWVSVLLFSACLTVQSNDAICREFQEGARKFVAELLAMEEPRDYRARQMLEVLIREAVGRYAFWRTNNIPYQHSPRALVTGSVSDAQLCVAVREITTAVRTSMDKESQQKFAITVLFRMCPAHLSVR